jgi:hypothetical protein
MQNTIHIPGSSEDFHYSSPYFGPQGSDPMEPDVYICIRLNLYFMMIIQAK